MEKDFPVVFPTGRDLAPTEVLQTSDDSAPTTSASDKCLRQEYSPTKVLQTWVLPDESTSDKISSDESAPCN